MKKKFYAILGLTFLVTSIYPLTLDKALKIGLNLSNLNVTAEKKMAVGFHAGVSLDIKLSRFFSLQPELFWVRKGGKSNYAELVPGFQAAIRIDYLEMPLLMKIQFLSWRKFHPYVFAGGYGGLKISASGRTEYRGQEISEDFGNDIQNHDFGLVVGAGAAVRWGERRWLIEMRYSHGLTRINHFTVEDDWRNRTFSLLLGIDF